MFLGVLSSSEVEVKVECLRSLNERGRHELRNFSTGKLLSSRNQSSIISISHISFILMHLLHSSSMTSFRPNSQGWVLDSQTFSIKQNQARFPVNSKDINCACSNSSTCFVILQSI
jgi:hypothetical protein